MTPFGKLLSLMIVAVLAIGGFVLWKMITPPSMNDTLTKNTEKVLALVTESVAYSPGAVGYLARPDDAGTYPGVVMVHEWWGLNEHIKVQAEKLAREGYVVLAVDLYGGRVATSSDEARTLVGAVDAEEALLNLRGASQYLRAEGAPKVASLGWCFGGGQSLKLALSGEPLDATVLYYGQLETDSEKLGALPAPLLGIFGETDTSIPVSSVEAFREGLNQKGIENEIYVYPAVGHAFANPSNPGFAPEETDDAWRKTLTFLSRHLKR